MVKNIGVENDYTELKDYENGIVNVLCITI